ncbi:MAG: uroporphyrinogen decarboxylase family protein [Phycisphaerae bacterium]
MNARERLVKVLTGRPADRVPFIKLFGGDNAVHRDWERQRPGIGKEIDAVLKFEGGYRGWRITPVNFWLCDVGQPRTLEEDDAHVVQRTADGTVWRWHKKQDHGHEYIEFAVKSRADWERIKREFLHADDPRRFPAEWPRLVEEYRTRDYALQLTHGGVYGFARKMMGDQALAYAFYDDPALVHDLMDSYTDMLIALWERMTAVVQFDLIECWEDMACRTGSIISPATFREFLLPNFRKVSRFAREHGIPIVMVDCDGLIEDLTGLMIEGGVTAMYPYEVQSGNDPFRVRRRFPTFAMLGGLDKQCMARHTAGDTRAIDAEMAKARRLIELGRFIPAPDHFVLSDVSWESYRIFMEKLREVVMTTRPGVSAAQDRPGPCMAGEAG